MKAKKIAPIGTRSYSCWTKKAPKGSPVVPWKTTGDAEAREKVGLHDEVQSHRKKKSAKLPLTEREHRLLRRARIRLVDLPDLTPEELHAAMGGETDQQRCCHLIALADLQQLGSVGPTIAEGFFRIGIHRVADLVGREPTDLHQQMAGAWHEKLDPCVEDVCRCAVAQAETPCLSDEYRQWWMWTNLRGKPAKARQKDPRPI